MTSYVMLGFHLQFSYFIFFFLFKRIMVYVVQREGNPFSSQAYHTFCITLLDVWERGSGLECVLLRGQASRFYLVSLFFSNQTATLSIEPKQRGPTCAITPPTNRKRKYCTHIRVCSEGKASWLCWKVCVSVCIHVCPSLRVRVLLLVL